MNGIEHYNVPRDVRSLIQQFIVYDVGDGSEWYHKLIPCLTAQRRIIISTILEKTFHLLKNYGICSTTYLVHGT